MLGKRYERPEEKSVFEKTAHRQAAYLNIYRQQHPEYQGTALDLLQDPVTRREWAEYYNSLTGVRAKTITTYLDTWKRLCRAIGISDSDPTIQWVMKENAKRREQFIAEEKENRLDETDRVYYSWPEVEALYDHLESLCKNNPDYKTRQQRLLLAMYIYMPPLRHNFSRVALFPDNPLETDNYIYSRDSKLIFHLGYDKVAFDKDRPGKGPVEFELPDPIAKLIDELPAYQSWLLTRPKPNERYLPLDEQGEWARTLNLMRTIPLPDGTPSNLNLFTIRSAFFTYHEPGLSENEIEELAKQMRTSVQCLRTNYRKLQ